MPERRLDPNDMPPIGSELELHIQLLKLASLINRPMREGVSEHANLTVDETKIMMCLGGEGPLAGHEISDLMGISAMNVSRALASLRKRGWIEPVAENGDRRRKPVQLSKRGLEAQLALTPDLTEVAQYLLGTLTSSERNSLGKTTAKVIKRMESWPQDHRGG
jgi:DNA-binding MarR family transcriptional regulator